MLFKEKSSWFVDSPSNSSRLNKRIQTILLVLVVVAISIVTLSPLRTRITRSTSSGSPYAYVTLLSQNPSLDNKIVPDNEDDYFVATRTLAYQLLHAPETRTNSSIPFIVLATEDVAPHKLDRLRLDGATVSAL